MSTPEQDRNAPPPPPWARHRAQRRHRLRRHRRRPGRAPAGVRPAAGAPAAPSGRSATELRPARPVRRRARATANRPRRRRTATAPGYPQPAYGQPPAPGYTAYGGTSPASRRARRCRSPVAAAGRRRDHRRRLRPAVGQGRRRDDQRVHPQRHRRQRQRRPGPHVLRRGARRHSGSRSSSPSGCSCSRSCRWCSPRFVMLIGARRPQRCPGHPERLRAFVDESRSAPACRSSSSAGWSALAGGIVSLAKRRR